MDMTPHIASNSAQLTADDLMSGPITVKITSVSGNQGNKDQPVTIDYENSNGKPFLPCKTMRRVLVSAYGPDASTYVGKRMTLYRDPDVQFGGIKCGGVRISHLSGLDAVMKLTLTASRSKRAPYTVNPLEDATPTIDTAAALQSARDAAKKGKAAFTDWWRENADKRDIVKPIMEELKAMVEEADAPEIDDEEMPL